MVFGRGGLEIVRGDMVWASLVATPLHEEAIAQAQHHCENQHSVVVAHPAAVVVVGDIQALMQTVLNAPGIPVQTQPVCRIQSPRLNTGNERQQPDSGQGGLGDADWKVGFGFQGKEPATGQNGFTDTVFAAQGHEAAQSSALAKKRRGAPHGGGCGRVRFSARR